LSSGSWRQPATVGKNAHDAHFAALACMREFVQMDPRMHQPDVAARVRLLI
jgi:hypothetical protein